MSESQQKVYADMRSQLEKLESDLAQSGISRDKLQLEYQKQIEEMKDKHNDEVETRPSDFALRYVVISTATVAASSIRAFLRPALEFQVIP